MKERAPHRCFPVGSVLVRVAILEDRPGDALAHYGRLRQAQGGVRRELAGAVADAEAGVEDRGSPRGRAGGRLTPCSPHAQTSCSCRRSRAWRPGMPVAGSQPFSSKYSSSISWSSDAGVTCPAMGPSAIGSCIMR